MRFCAVPGCRALVDRGRCAVHRHQRDRTREALAGWRVLYRSMRWRAVRRRQLADHPLCADCSDAGRVEPATEVHHITKAREDVDGFFDGPFKSLCRRCHQARTARGE